MFGIGSEELLIIIIFSILVFDPDKLPDAGRRLGRALRHFRKTKQDVQDVVQKEVIRPLEAADAKVKDDMQKIENSVKVGSFDDLLYEKNSSSKPESHHHDSESKHVSDTTSQDPSIQQMADLLYGIDDGEEDKKEK